MRHTTTTTAAALGIVLVGLVTLGVTAAGPGAGVWAERAGGAWKGPPVRGTNRTPGLAVVDLRGHPAGRPSAAAAGLSAAAAV